MSISTFLFCLVYILTWCLCQPCGIIGFVNLSNPIINFILLPNQSRLFQLLAVITFYAKGWNLIMQWCRESLTQTFLLHHFKAVSFFSGDLMELICKYDLGRKGQKCHFHKSF